MGQLCCFPFSRAEDKLSAKRGPELDDEELVSLSKRLVEDAVSRAVRQYVEEMTKNGMATKNEAVPPPQPPTASPNTTTTK